MFCVGGEDSAHMAGPVATAATEDFSRCFLQKVLDLIGTFLLSSAWIWSHTLFTAKQDRPLTST